MQKIVSTDQPVTEIWSFKDSCNLIGWHNTTMPSIDHKISKTMLSAFYLHETESRCKILTNLMIHSGDISLLTILQFDWPITHEIDRCFLDVGFYRGQAIMSTFITNI